MKRKYYILVASFILWMACGKKNPVPPQSFALTFLVNGSNNGTLNYAGLNLDPVIRFSFSSPVQSANIGSAFTLIDKSNTPVSVSTQLMSNDSVVIVKPSSVLKGFSSYTLSVSSGLLSSTKGTLTNPITIHLQTGIDSSDKFPQITDSALLTLVQQQTFKYFWDFAHPVSGLARERDNGDNEVVTTGGSGFGIMAIIVAANRGFITRTDAVSRINTILNFLITKCQRWHGAFSHWINGSTGATVAFGTNNGADIVETSYLLQGLLTARQYFNNLSDVNETALRDSVNSIWNAVEWKWFTQNGSTSSMYWQYNPSYTANTDIWSIPVNGWNEALITYVLAASSPNYSISKGVYDTGWARNGAMVNGSSYYGIGLPLGESYGGPLFFAHYSFLGINPNNLSDAYANYWTQNVSHAKINYAYCVANPNHYYGYSNLCWGLTASDIPNGYTASSPTNDVGVIAPTGAISSLPYTPTESMNALRFFYYKLGDNLWGNYGFIDAFDLNTGWFAPSHLAIDEGPIICMIENYRTGLLWNLFMSCPEIKTGMKDLGFTSPNLN
ncbi:MAG: Ig-like domain-containing protein [Bacteroidetes bacterium]|nr:Ig-like domain-containing protein [Bacteroidota bacterium]